MQSTSQPPRRRTIDAFSITEPVGFLSLEARITPYLTTGFRSRAFGANGRVGAWAPATLRSAWSTMRSALLTAMQATLPEDLQSRARAEEALSVGKAGADIRPFLQTLPEIAASLRKEGPSAANAANQVRVLRRALISGCTDRSPLDVKAAALSSAWADFIAALNSQAPPIRSSVRSGIFKLASVASDLGLPAPADLPSDPLALAEWLRRALPNDDDYFAVRSALKRLPAAAPDLACAITVPARHSTAMRLSPDAVVHADVATREVPALATFLRAWDSVAERGHTDCASQTIERLRFSLERFTTYAVLAARAGVLPDGLLLRPTVLDWWTTEMPGALTRVAHTRLNVGPQVGDEHIMATTADTANSVAPVMTNAVAAVLAWAARNGHMPKSAQLASGDLPRSVLAELEAIWRMTVHWMTDAEGRGPVRGETRLAYLAARAAYNSARKTLRAGEAEGDEHLTMKDKDEAAKMHSLPLLLGVVLPYWSLVHLPRLQANLDAITTKLDALRASSPADTHWPGGVHRDEVIARKALTTAIRVWFIFITFIADPLRIKNHWAARVGKDKAEVMIDADFTPDGRVRRIHRIHSRFGGETFAIMRGNPLAMLKTRDYKSRSWDWPQVVVDHRWAARYINEVWFPILQRAGVLPDGATVQSALAENRYALLPTDGGTQRGTKAVDGGDGDGGVARYATAQSVRVLFRQALLTGLRALGPSVASLTGDTVPASDEEAAQRWPWILSPHVVRLWWVTFCLGVLSKNGFALRRTDPATNEHHLINPIDIAQRATTDSPKTMEKDYEACSDTMHQRTMRTVIDWTHPRAFASVTDYLAMPDRRPDIKALWREWAGARAGDGAGMLPPELIRAFLERERGTDVRVPQMRRRAINNHPPARRATKTPA